MVAGPLRQLPGVRQFLEGKDRVGGENSMGIISDEEEDSARLEALIADLAGRLDRAARAKYQKGVNFLGVGGIKYSAKSSIPGSSEQKRFSSQACIVAPIPVVRGSR
jgi:hypothetical protein